MGNNHWNEMVQETVLSASNPDQLYFTLIGGADEGQFPHIGDIQQRPEDVNVSVRGHGLNIGDVLLEIQGQKVSGFTGQDVQEVLKQCLTNGKMVVVRAVPKGKQNLFRLQESQCKKPAKKFDFWHQRPSTASILFDSQ